MEGEPLHFGSEDGSTPSIIEVSFTVETLGWCYGASGPFKLGLVAETGFDMIYK